MLLQYISLSIIHVFLFISLRCPDPIPPGNFWKINNTKSKLGHPSPANKITHWWKVLDPRLNRYIFFIIKASCHIFKGRFFWQLKVLITKIQIWSRTHHFCYTLRPPCRCETHCNLASAMSRTEGISRESFALWNGHWKQNQNLFWIFRDLSSLWL